MCDGINDGKDRIYDGEPLHSKKFCQFERNPRLETTITTRLNPKHVHERARIVQKTTNKISQAVHCRWHVHRWGWVGPITGVSFGRVDRGKVGIIAVVILSDALQEMIWLDGYVEKQSPTNRSKRVCLGQDRFDDSVILIHVYIWN